MKILVNKAHYPVSVLGYGKRIGIWLQGCSIHCPSCCSLDTWEFSENYGIDVGELVDWCKGFPVDSVEGVTISGGEPFDQPEALLALIKDLSSMRNKTRKHMDVLIYTGYSENRVRRKFSQHLLYIDALVVGPFVEGVAESKPYRGSDNQRIILYTALGEKRYGPENLANWKSGMQVAADDEGIWMIGIPRQGDLQKFEVGCSNQGLSLGKSSWRC